MINDKIISHFFQTIYTELFLCASLSKKNAPSSIDDEFAATPIFKLIFG